MMRVAVVRNPRNETSQMLLASIDTAAKTLGIQVKLIKMSLEAKLRSS